jgi:putative ABC transport system permease protein
MLEDLKFALRRLRKSPGFTLTAVLTLAIGVGGVVAVFSVVEAVLMRPLPFRDSGSLVRLHEGVEHQFDTADLPAPDVIRMMRDNRSFSAVAGFISAAYELNGAGGAFQAHAERVSASLFSMLGVQPLIGRAFTQSEDEHSAPVALISYSLWRERLGADPKIVGKTIDLDRRPYTILGVMPQSFEFPLDAGRLNHRDLWVPMSFTPDEKQDETDNFMYGAVARLKPGITMEQARADVRRVITAIEAEIPPKDGIHLTSSVVGLQEETVEKARPLLRTLMVASLLILGIACVNLANLLLARGARRRREFGVRLALGAGRRAMLRQSLIESLSLSVFGSIVGMALAVLLVRVAVVNLPDSLPRLNEIGVRWSMLSVALALAGLTGLLCGLVPAFGSMRSEVLDALREGSQGAGQSRAQHRLRSTLVIVEVALAMVLLVASGLLLRSFQKMLETDPGFQAQNVLTAYLSLPNTDYSQQAKVDGFYRELMQRLAALPGVTAAGAASNVPTAGIRSDRNFVPENFTVRDGRRWASASNYFVKGDYFRAIRIPLLHGRYLNAADDLPDAPLVAVVSQTLAQRYWPKEEAVGKRFRMGGNPSGKRPLLTVVGVVGDIRQGALDQEVIPQMYEPASQYARQFEPEVAKFISTGTMGDFYLAVRSTGAPVSAAAMEKTVHQLDPMLAVSHVTTMQERIAMTETPRRFNTMILTAFAGIALLLALLGIYGVLAYTVAERTREIAIRMALGATQEDVLRRTIRSALLLAAVGVACGFAASAGMTRFLASMLYGVKPLDATAIAAAVVLLLLCAALAAWIPARRAASVDPMEALRNE